MLDANATAGLLYEIFGAEMTAAPTECATCGNEGEIGELLAFTEGPGIVLRCSACENVVLRIVQTSEAIYLDVRWCSLFTTGSVTGNAAIGKRKQAEFTKEMGN